MKTNQNIFILTDRNISRYYKKYLSRILPSALWLIIPVGEKNKNLSTCEKIWKTLTFHHADRNSLLINFGGGVICDMGGFVASVYKRGIPFINIPTTLMSMADAAIGGKTGINFQNFKNHLGFFCFPEKIYINPDFLKTLPSREYLSGWAEIVKHALISDAGKFSKLPLEIPSHTKIRSYISDSIRFKFKIVEKDIYDTGERKMLNFGHTIGHALESAFLEKNKPISHGLAVATGMICEAWISYQKKMLPAVQFFNISETIQRYFLKINLTREIEKSILTNIYQDKKNCNGKIQCVLLSGIGKPVIDCVITEGEVREALRFYEG